MPPVARIGAVRSFGAACRRPIVAIKLDFPDPLGPTSAEMDEANRRAGAYPGTSPEE